MMQRLPLLTAEEAQQIVQKIDNLKPYWIKRQNNFYTLGMALYLDKNDHSSSYDANVPLLNQVLYAHFSHLYQKLLNTLKHTLQEEVSYELSLALPGFHIFLSCPEWIERGGKLHFDLQFKQANWSQYRQVDVSRSLSFTLALALPQLGAGLNYWDKQYETIPTESPEKAILNVPMQHVEYEVGKMVIHSGLIAHQIAPAKEHREKDRRITLQGHALRCDGSWKVYW